MARPMENDSDLLTDFLMGWPKVRQRVTHLVTPKGLHLDYRWVNRLEKHLVTLMDWLRAKRLGFPTANHLARHSVNDLD